MSDVKLSTRLLVGKRKGSPGAKAPACARPGEGWTTYTRFLIVYIITLSRDDERNC